MDCIEYITAFYPDDPSLGFESGGTHEPVGELVRCRGCGMRGPDGFCDMLQRAVPDDGYCAWGERRG